jgi:hypothetical protein
VSDRVECRGFHSLCLRQLQEALAKHRDESRQQIIAEAGAPIQLTHAVQQDTCIEDDAIRIAND